MCRISFVADIQVIIEELAVCAGLWHAGCLFPDIGSGIPSLRCHLIVLSVRCHGSWVLFCRLAPRGVITVQFLAPLFPCGTNDVSNANFGSRGVANSKGV
jgi:hypothetical protein